MLAGKLLDESETQQSAFLPGFGPLAGVSHREIAVAGLVVLDRRHENKKPNADH